MNRLYFGEQRDVASICHFERSRERSEWDERHGRLGSVGSCERVGRRTSQTLDVSLNEPPLFRRQFKMAFESKEFPDASVDLVYLDPPFNSNADYNVLFR
jgi:16S rRNA G966 N2-methylase RsmD